MKKVLLVLGLLVIAMFIISCGGQKAASATGAAVKKVQEQTEKVQKVLPETKETIEKIAEKAVETTTKAVDSFNGEEIPAEAAQPSSDNVHNIAVVSKCSDSDGGNNIKVRGKTISLGKIYYDYCGANGYTLFERTCINDQMVSMGYDCGLAGDGYKCVDGVCQS
jgi:hypothetical protein